MRRFLLPILLLAAAAGCGRDTDPAYVAEVDAWHAQRVERLRSDTGWLTLVGLHPLVEGANLVGSDPAAEVRLIDKAPARVGLLALEAGQVDFATFPETEVFELGREAEGPLGHLPLATDHAPEPTLLVCGSLVFHVIERDGAFFLRVKDREADLLRSFTGIERYPVDARWRVTARLEAGPGELSVPNVLGQESLAPSPGVLVFRLDGREQRLTPTGEPGGPLFLVFGDASNGHGTYPGGRFLSADPPDAAGEVVLDFNRAVNPPCVFTPYATCPLPPPGNRLPVAVTAGEKTWGADH